MVSNPVECDFTLSSHLEDTADHSLSLSCLEWEVPKELLLHWSKLIPPQVLGTERFEENKFTSIKRRRMIVQCNEEDEENNCYTQTDRLTDMQNTYPPSTLYWARYKIAVKLEYHPKSGQNWDNLR